jgi:CAI-1 autoinducer synthase
MAFVSSNAALERIDVESAADPEFLTRRVSHYYVDRLEGQCGGVHPMKGRMPGANDIRLRTNDYLCLSQHPRIIAAEVDALQRYGHGESVSRIWMHHQQDPLNVFEKRVATLMDTAPMLD